MAPEFVFDEYPRKVYKRTFLNTVFVVFSYSVEDVSQKTLSSINQFLRDNFNSQEDVVRETFLHGFSFDSEEKGLSYFFSAKHLGIKYLKDDYVSFQQTMMPLLYPLIAFLKDTISVNTIADIDIRKVNIWAAKCQGNEPFDEKSLVNSFLSPSLISDAGSCGDDTDLRDAHMLKGKTNSLSFEVRYGFKDREFKGDKYCGLILDERVNADSVSVENVEKALLNANNTLYNIFHWSVSKQTLAYMDKEV